MTIHASRRALVGGAGLIAAAALAKCRSTPAYAAADHDASIEKHWNARCAAFRGFENYPLTPDDNQAVDDAEKCSDLARENFGISSRTWSRQHDAL